MSQSWDDYAENWDTNSDVIIYSQKAYETLCDEVDLKELAVLDFGCGTGLLCEKISSLASSVLAVDSSPKMIDELLKKNLPNVKLLACEVSEQAIQSNHLLQTKFDLIVASSVCAFLSDFEKTLFDLKSLLRPDGLFIQWDWKCSEREPDFGFSQEMILDAYANVGLNIITVKTAFSLSTEKGPMEVIMGIGKNS